MSILENEVTLVRKYENYYCYEWAIKFECICKNCLGECKIRSPVLEAESIMNEDFSIIIDLLDHVKPIIIKLQWRSAPQQFNYNIRINVKKLNNKLTYSKLFTNIGCVGYLSYSNELEFIKFSLINNCNYMPEKVLTLSVEIFRPDNVMISNAKNANIGKSLKSLQQNEYFSDLTLVVGEREFHVHKAILAAQSSVFLAMFKNDMKETNENKVVIQDISEQCMQQIVNYMYSGTIEKESFEALATEILIAADKYNLENLISICEDVMVNTLNVNNVLKMLKTSAIDYKLDALKTCAINFIAKNIKDVVETNEFKTLILDPKNLCLMKEIILAFSTMKWIAEEEEE